VAHPANPSSEYKKRMMAEAIHASVSDHERTLQVIAPDALRKKMIDVQVGDIITLDISEKSHSIAWNQNLVVSCKIERYQDTDNVYLRLKLERPYMIHSGVTDIAYIGLERWEYVRPVASAEQEWCHYYVQ